MKDDTFKIVLFQSATGSCDDWVRIFEFIFITEKGVDTTFAQDLISAIEETIKRRRKDTEGIEKEIRKLLPPGLRLLTLKEK